jgi:hypothetical protein
MKLWNTHKWVHRSIWLGMLFLLYACKSTQSGLSTRPRYDKEDKIAVQSLAALPDFSSFYTKMKLKLTVNGKKRALRGHVKIKKNQLIQLSIAPLLGIEMARLEVRPSELLLIDRIHRKYIKAPIHRLREIFQCDLDFKSLQALFLHRMFHPHKRKVKLNQFTIQHLTDAQQWQLSVKDKKACVYVFQIDQHTHTLQSTQLITPEPSTVVFNYAYFKPTSVQSFPTQLNMKAQSEAVKMEGKFTFSRISWKKRKIKPTTLSKRYERVITDDLLKLLLPQ